ncbi:unnamed protein product [Hydatigera taeniaeformis]|uniref:Ras-specific guanine nucleotide-releasing factor 2 n=1 Tax=Hydatigena taeniaeformis TaxID=6205 RepID=A0A0R3X1Z0_HYDTA|nr:unnamed protein product [Hydatigera taeniaeformis]
MRKQFTYLATKAREDSQATMSGYLWKKNAFSGKWRQRYFVLYQNLLFQFVSDKLDRGPCGLALLEGCYCEKTLVLRTSRNPRTATQHDHCFTICCLPKRKKYYELRADSEEECDDWVAAIRSARHEEEEEEEEESEAEAVKEEEEEDKNITDYAIRLRGKLYRCVTLHFSPCRYSSVIKSRQEVRENQAYLLQILETERKAKLQYLQQTDDLEAEIKKLKNEVTSRRTGLPSVLPPLSLTPIPSPGREASSAKSWKVIFLIGRDDLNAIAPAAKANVKVVAEEDDDQIRKIKKLSNNKSFDAVLAKVQSFLRGWLCRRRWKHIVEEYLLSPHAESMRKRNSIVFKLFEGEEEYVQQLVTLVTCFLRPFRMAASSKKPIITHEDVNSIYLNVETIMFLHQIFVQGLRRKMENWPTLKLGDLFDMLLPMLGVYQEYVRNHHYSLQVLAEYKMKEEFTRTLKRCEEKSQCEGRSIESLLTCPMYQIPRYLVTLHEILAHTPHEHVDRTNLEFAKSKLETLSQVIHDEVSETENIRKNLAIERMISDGCDILLDANQVFVRQGTLVQVTMHKAAYPCPRITQLNSSSCEKKERLRQVFLFTNHLLIATRTSSGRLKLAKKSGKIPLRGCNLIEEMPHDWSQDDVVTASSLSNDTPECGPSPISRTQSACSFGGQEELGPAESQHHQQPTQTSPPWNSIPAKLAHGSLMLAALTLGSTGGDCAGKSRRDARPGSFTRKDVVDDLSDDSPAYSPPMIATASATKPAHPLCGYGNLVFQIIWPGGEEGTCSVCLVASNLQEKEAWCSDISQCIEQLHCSDLLSTAQSEVSSISMPYSVRLDPGLFKDCPDIKYRSTRNSCKMPQVKCPFNLTFYCESIAKFPFRLIKVRHGTLGRLLDRLLDPRFQSIDYLNTFLLTYRVFTTGPTIIAVLRCVLRDPSLQLASTKINLDLLESMLRTKSGSRSGRQQRIYFSTVAKGGRRVSTGMLDAKRHKALVSRQNLPTQIVLKEEETESGGSESEKDTEKWRIRSASEHSNLTDFRLSDATVDNEQVSLERLCNPQDKDFLMVGAGNGENGDLILTQESKSICQEEKHDRELEEEGGGTRREDASKIEQREVETGKQSIASEIIAPVANAGSLLMSFFENKDNQSAFSLGQPIIESHSFATSLPRERANLIRQRSRVSYAYNMSTYRRPPKAGAIITSARMSRRRSSNLAAVKAFAIATAASGSTQIPHHKAPAVKKLPLSATAAVATSSSSQGGKMKPVAATTLPPDGTTCNEAEIQFPRLAPPSTKEGREAVIPSKATFDRIPALDIAEELTYLDFHIFRSIKTQELLNQVWMKDGKEAKAPHVMLVTKRFNEVSKLVVSEIISRSQIPDRAACIEKWIAIADICRCLQNYNGVLQICAALENSSVHRLKATWEVVAKPSKQSLEKLLTLVAANARFKNMREQLHQCDPPCIPYLGMYLTDLSFIEEGALDITEHGLINFCKMRMVVDYLLDPTRLLSDDQTYEASLSIEPRPHFTAVCQATGVTDEVVGKWTPCQRT